MISLQNNAKRAEEIIKILQAATKNMLEPASTLIVKKFGKEPFLILIGCLLSLRTKDTTSFPASCRLFLQAKTVQEMFSLPLEQIKALIYPVCFYRRKAQQIHQICYILLKNYEGKVPQTEKELLSLPGVGQKTANLVLGEAFDIPAICVDIHVHRISNRLGIVESHTPEQTEYQLKNVIPKEYWTLYNKLLVMWGQNICKPISPLCSKCVLRPLCPRIGVQRSR